MAEITLKIKGSRPAPYTLSIKKGIKYIIGCELYAVDNHLEKRPGKNEHIVLLAKNKTGYKNIVKNELGENATEEEILNRSTEMLAADLARSELSMDIFEKWETKALVQDKLVALITADVEVTDEEIDAYTSTTSDNLNFVNK